MKPPDSVQDGDHRTTEVAVTVTKGDESLGEVQAPTPLGGLDGVEKDGVEKGARGREGQASAEIMINKVDLKRVLHVLLEWRHLRYWVPLGRPGGQGPCGCWGKGPSQTKTILSDLSGAVQPGRLLAIMGPSGCGKTSLINALAGRLPVGGTLEGEVLVNGFPRGKGFNSISAYVMQDDVMFHNLTVRETFEFAAAMRLPPSISPASKAVLVNDIIAELGLTKVERTYVGNAFVRGVSGGERKRVNIGIQLLSNPSLIFLDEPTSGLDAYQAQNVTETLLGLARSGRSVVATVHQPRSSIYLMFDLLLLLTEGRAVYFGPGSEAVAWFEARGLPCPKHFNPADFFLDSISGDRRSPAAEQLARQRVAALADAFAAEQEAAGGAKARAVAVAAADAQRMQEINDSPAFPNSIPVQFGLLLNRAWKQQSRDRLPQVITIMQTVIIGFVLAALFSDMGKDQTGINDEIGILFFTSVFNAMASMFGALNTFPMERNIINRERAGRAYHVLPYFLARFICDMPIRVGQGLIFGCIVYWIVGLNPAAAAFFKFVAFIVLDALASQGLGVAVSAAVKTEKLAFAVAPAVTIVLLLFGGFFVNKDSIPAAIRWIMFLSHLYWCFMGLSINDFSGRTGWTCNDGSVSPGCITTGYQILARLGFEDNELWQPYTGLAVLVLFYNTMGYLVLRISKPRFLPLTPAPLKKRA